MSVINVSKMWSKEGGTFTSEKFDAFAATYALTEGYQVLVDVGTSILEVATATGIPQYGTIHSSGIFAHVNDIKPEQVSPILWMVIVGYSGENPYTGAVDVEWSDVSTSEPIDRDYDGAPIVTSNTEPVEGLSFDLADQIVVISRKFLSINTVAIAEYRHAVNSDTFLGWPPGTAKLVGYSAKNMFKSGAPQQLWDVTARIQFRRGLMGATDAQAWYKRFRHEGIYVRNLIENPAVPGALIPDPDPRNSSRARDINGQEVTKPVLLKPDGTQEFDPNNAIWLYRKVYGSLPYSGLGLV
jgi:hypothetical protein